MVEGSDCVMCPKGKERRGSGRGVSLLTGPKHQGFGPWVTAGMMGPEVRGREPLVEEPRR